MSQYQQKEEITYECMYKGEVHINANFIGSYYNSPKPSKDCKTILITQDGRKYYIPEELWKVEYNIGLALYRNK